MDRKLVFVQKKHLKMAYFCLHESGLPDFGRPWTPNRWHQVNFSGWALILFPPPCTELVKKIIFLMKPSVPENFQQDFFWGSYPRNSEDSDCFEFLSLRFEVIAAQSKTIETKWVVKQEISGVTKQRHSANLRPITCHSEIEWRVAQRSWANVHSISDLLVKNWWSVLALWHWTASAFRQHLNFNLKL